MDRDLDTIVRCAISPFFFCICWRRSLGWPVPAARVLWLPSPTLDLAFNLNLSPLQAADISDLLQVAGKHDHRKRTSAIVLAEIKEVHARVSLLNAQDFPGDALGGANMLHGFRVRNALRKSRWREAGKQDDREENSRNKTTPAHKDETALNCRR